jgi:5-methylcytosine-specific restriction enzyme B
MSTLESWPAFLRPTLQVLADGQTWRTADLYGAVTDAMDLTDAQRAEKLNSGEPRAHDRISWALYHLRRAGAVRKVKNGHSTITDVGRKLLEDNSESLTLEALAALPAYQNYQPRSQRDVTTEPAEEGRPYWFVGAYFDGTDDMSAEFVEQGVWRNGYTDRYADIVNAMAPGDRIAIKAAYVRKYELPFDNKHNLVSVMAIKATGTITANHADGQTVEVDWDPQQDPREWYFFTNQRTVWKVVAGDWKTDALIAFTFDGVDQDIDEFRNAEYWRPRFGDEVEPIDDGDDDPDDGDDGGALPPEIESYGIADIVADGCFVPEPELAEYLAALRSDKNLILQGPPGTGKTWLAKRLGYALIGEKNRAYLRAIQFHPSTSYEDFVRGWRPSGSGLGLTDGIFLEVVVDAHANPGRDYVLVIEEINRGNLAQIFGELLTLLEADKRTPSEAIELTYRRGKETLHLPENLYIIGTMNLADRSLAIVDFALRRRFGYAQLEPQFNAAWRDWVHDRNGVPRPELDVIAGRVAEVNASIAGDPALGDQYLIGHSFFVPAPTRKITDVAGWVEQVVLRKLQPLLNEYWFDEPERVAAATATLLGR